ncbi:MAG: Hint domain-containing protein, partial [Aureliella sp.]
RQDLTHLGVDFTKAPDQIHADGTKWFLIATVQIDAPGTLKAILHSSNPGSDQTVVDGFKVTAHAASEESDYDHENRLTATRSYRPGETTPFEETRYAYDVLGRLVAAQSIHRDATSVPTENIVTTGFALQGSQTVLSYSLDSGTFGKITSANFVGANGQIVAIDRSFDGQTKDIQQQFSVWQYNDLEGRKFTDGDQWGAAAYRFTPGKIEMDFELLTVDFAYKTWDTARDLWARNAASILGTAQAIGGISQIAGGIGACLGIVTCGVGFAVALHGLDDLVTGLDTAASGEFKQSYTNYGLLQGAQMAGFSEDTAKRIADTGEIGMGLLTGGLGDAARTVGKQAAKSSAMAVAKNVLQHAGTRLAVEGGTTVGVGLGVGIATNSFENGLFAAQFGQIAGGIAADFSVACFTAGTPIVVDLEGNSRPIEELEVGDMVLARSEFDPNGPLELKRIEEKFVRTAAVMELVVRGRSIKTTAEHPFYVAAQGKFVAAGELQAGDELVSHTGQLARIEAVSRLGEITTVYNVRVAEHHTYFVGGRTWDLSVWVHNATYALKASDIPELAGKYRDLRNSGVRGRIRLLHPESGEVLTTSQMRRVKDYANKTFADMDRSGVSGPRTQFDESAHNELIARLSSSLPDGHRIIAGGRDSNMKAIAPETYFDTLGGYLSKRRPDVLIQRPDDSLYGINVGLSERSGLPVPREQEALHDLTVYGRLEMLFFSYGIR